MSAAAKETALADAPGPCVDCGQPAVLLVHGTRRHYRCYLAATPGEPAEVRDDLTADAAPLRFLAALETTCAPRRKDGHRMRDPFWRPELPGPLGAVHVVPSWTWSRPYVGPVTVLDRAGAFLAAASSAEVAHGRLEPAGQEPYAGRPGMYRVPVYQWHETGMPNPLGRDLPAGPDRSVWLMAPRVGLLAELVDAGRWPDVTVLESYTGEPVRLTAWARHIQQQRADVIRRAGRGSDTYAAVKIAYSQALALMLGTPTPGQGRTWKCGVHRPDWTLTIQDQAAVTLWRWADACRKLAPPQLAPVGMRNVDELLLPSGALELVTTRKRVDGRPPLRLDPDGIALGAFRVKSGEVWG